MKISAGVKAAAVVTTVGLLATSCSAVAQKNPHGGADKTDVIACHSLGQSMKDPTQALVSQTSSDLEKASNSTLRSKARAAEAAVTAGNEPAFSQDMEAIAKTCRSLGLLDANGNPT